MELKDLGNAVQIGTRKIPAVNIQILDWPACIIIDGHTYGIYFEIPIETGALVVVSKASKGDNILMEAYPFWDKNDTIKLNVTLINWETFLTTLDSFVDWVTNMKEGEYVNV